MTRFRILILALVLALPSLAYAQAEGPQERQLDQALATSSSGEVAPGSPGYVQITPQTDADIERKIAADAAARRMQQPTALAPVVQSSNMPSRNGPSGNVPPAPISPAASRWEGPQERELDREMGSDTVTVEPPSAADPESAETHRLNGGN